MINNVLIELPCIRWYMNKNNSSTAFIQTNLNYKKYPSQTTNRKKTIIYNTNIFIQLMYKEEYYYFLIF